MKVKKLKCQLVDGDGCFTEDFDKSSGWQERVKDWVKSHGRVLKSDACVNIYTSPDGIVWTFSRSIPVPGDYRKPWNSTDSQ